jgi:hypothetical protein
MKTEIIKIDNKYSVQGWDEHQDLVIVYNTGDFNDANVFAQKFVLPRTDIATVMVIDVASGKGLSLNTGNMNDINIGHRKIDLFTICVDMTNLMPVLNFDKYDDFASLRILCESGYSKEQLAEIVVDKVKDELENSVMYFENDDYSETLYNYIRETVFNFVVNDDMDDTIANAFLFTHNMDVDIHLSTNELRIWFMLNY